MNSVLLLFVLLTSGVQATALCLTGDGLAGAWGGLFSAPSLVGAEGVTHKLAGVLSKNKQ